MDMAKLGRDIVALKDLKSSADRLALARKLKDELAAAELECVRDFAIPFEQVRNIKILIPIIEGHVSRLEAGLRRRGR